MRRLNSSSVLKVPTITNHNKNRHACEEHCTPSLNRVLRTVLWSLHKAKTGIAAPEGSPGM